MIVWRTVTIRMVFVTQVKRPISENTAGNFQFSFLLKSIYEIFGKNIFSHLLYHWISRNFGKNFSREVVPPFFNFKKRSFLQEKIRGGTKGAHDRGSPGG